MSDDSLVLLTCFFKALSHKIRTPLSVISNDLQYLKSENTSSEIERPLRKVGEISEMLSDISARLETKGKLTTINLEDFFSEVGIVISDESNACEIFSDKDLLRVAFLSLMKLFCLSKVTLRKDPTGVMLAGQGDFREECGEGEEFVFFTSILNEKLALNAVETPIIDAIFLALNILVRGRFSKNLITFEMLLPYESRSSG